MIFLQIFYVYFLIDMLYRRYG